MLNVKEAAKRLAISPSKLYELVERRKIIHYRIGGKVLLREEDVTDYLEDCRVEVRIEVQRRRVVMPALSHPAMRVAR